MILRRQLFALLCRRIVQRGGRLAGAAALAAVCACALVALPGCGGGQAADTTSPDPAENGKAPAEATGEPPSGDQPGNGNAKPARPAKRLDITFDDLKFPMEKTETFRREMLTDKVESLAGKPIRIRGYILPTYRQKGIPVFILVRDNKECCFGPGAALYDSIKVTMEEGKTIEYTRYPVAVEGVFRIEVEEDEFLGQIVTVFQMTGTRVK